MKDEKKKLQTREGAGVTEAAAAVVVALSGAGEGWSVRGNVRRKLRMSGNAR